MAGHPAYPGVRCGVDARVAENPQGRKGTEKGPATPPHMRVRVPWLPVWSVWLRASPPLPVAQSPRSNLNEGFKMF